MLFRSPKSLVTFTVYPMIHVGEEGFYAAVYQEAFDHDVAIVEGIRSPVTRHLTRSYRWIDLEKLGLILQPRSPHPDSVKARLILADLSPEEFHLQWCKVPLRLRVLFYVFAPLVGLHRRLFASRQSLAQGISLDDHRSDEEILAWEPELEIVNHSILHARDARILDCIAAELDPPCHMEKRVAIVFGAQHMRAVLKDLSQRGFYADRCSWLTVFSL